MANQVASTNTVNIVPVQGVFDSSGNLITFVGPAGQNFTPPAIAAANQLTGTTLAPNVVFSNLTSLGIINN